MQPSTTSDSTLSADLADRLQATQDLCRCLLRWEEVDAQAFQSAKSISNELLSSLTKAQRNTLLNRLETLYSELFLAGNAAKNTSLRKALQEARDHAKNLVQRPN